MAVLFLSGLGQAFAQTSFAAYDVPVPGYISDLTQGPDGAIWFASYSAVGRLDPVTGQVRLYGEDAGRIISGPDGLLWFTRVNRCGIARMTTAGTVTDVPAVFAHCPIALTVGPDNAVWFATGSTIGRIASSGAYSEYPAGSISVNDLTTGPDGALWYVSNNSSAPGVGRMTTAGAHTWFQWSGPGYGLLRITSGPDGALWATAIRDRYNNWPITRVTTAGAFTRYDLPVTADYVSTGGITKGPGGALWFTIPLLRWFGTDTSAHAIGRINTDGTSAIYQIPDSFGVYPDPFNGMGIIAGPYGSLWYAGDSFYGQRPVAIGRVVLGPKDTIQPSSRVTALPPTEPLANFQVQWSGTDTGLGVRDYDIYASDNGGPFRFWTRTTATRVIYTGIAGHTYGFYSVARDRAGNVEEVKVAAEAVTTVAPVVPGDVNADGSVDCGDVAIVKASFGKRTGQPGFDSRADVNHDGAVDVRDLAFVMQKLTPGTACR